MSAAAAMDLADVQAIFFEECDEALATAEAGLALLAAGAPADPEAVNGVFRAVHSIKGGAGAFGMDGVRAFAHAFENALDGVRAGRLGLSPPLLALLQGARDVLADHVAAARGLGAPPRDAEALAALERAAAGGGDAAGDPPAPAPGPVAPPVAPPCGAPEASPAAPWRIALAPTRGMLLRGVEPACLLAELAEASRAADPDFEPVVALDAAAVPGLDALDPLEPALRWDVALAPGLGRDAIEEVLAFAGEDGVAVAAPAGAAAGVADAAAEADEFGFVPVTVDLDALAVPGAGADLAAAAPPPPPPPAPAPTPVPAPAPPAAPAAPAAAVMPTGGAAPRQTAAAAPAAAGPAPGAVVRVDVAKVDRVVDLVGELVIAQAMLATDLAAAPSAASAAADGPRGPGCAAGGGRALGEIARLTRALQDAVMSMRAQPVRTVFGRVPRLLRELAEATGKPVRLETEGEETEIDKTVVERLGEPIVHLIRNAVDHGIEDAAGRSAAGKDPVGTVRLSAAQRAGRIVIQIADDGRGIDRARVLAKAVERGIVPPGAAPSDEEVDQLIFAPGFSTAARVSDISGRGVGLDVVRQNVLATGGRVQVQSAPGRGTAFVLSLPLTLAVLDGMVVRVAGQTFVVPLSAVVEMLPRVPPARELPPAAAGGGRRVIGVRGAQLALIDVAGVLALRGGPAAAGRPIVLIADSERAGRVGLLVDAVEDQRQVVIKSIERNYRAVPGVAGATILGDGRVALILDVETLAEMAHGGAA